MADCFVERGRHPGHRIDALEGGLLTEPTMRESVMLTSGRELSRLQFCLLAVLLVGLLSFPSISSSGAEVPHPHPLFMLNAHHHHEDGEIDWHPVNNDGRTDSSGRTADTGPSVQEPTPEFLNGEPLGMTLMTIPIRGAIGTMTPLYTLDSHPGDHVFPAPELPPPRI